MSIFTLLGVICWAAALLQPLHLLPWVSWHSEFAAFAAATFLFAGTVQLAHRSKILLISVPTVVWPFAVLLAITLLQTWSGLIGFFGDGFSIAGYLLLCILGLQIGYVHGPNEQVDGAGGPYGLQLLETITLASLVVAQASVVLSLVQALDVWTTQDWVVRSPDLLRSGANIGQPNQLATLLVMGMASLAYLYEKKKLSPFVSVVLYVALLVGMTMTASRSGILSTAMLAAWWLGAGRRANLMRTSWKVVLYGSVFLVVMLVAWPSVAGMVQEGTWTASQGRDYIKVNATGSSRSLMWGQIMDAISQRPWFGWGLREVSAAHNAVVHNAVVSEPYTYAHNVLLELAIGVGLPLAAILVCVTTWWLAHRIKHATQRSTWFCLAYILPFVVHSLLEFPFAYAYFLLPVCILIGVLEASQSTPSKLKLNIRWVASGVVAYAVLLGWSCYEYVGLEEDFRIARFEALRYGTTPADYQRPTIHLLTQLSALNWASRSIPTPAMREDEIETLKKVALRFPWIATQNRYALALALNGNPQEAIRQLRVMRALHGEKSYVRLRHSWIELADGKYSQLRNLQLP